MNLENFEELAKETRIVKMPSVKIATFGQSVYPYYILSRLKPNLTRVRNGVLMVNKPLIISTDVENVNLLNGFDTNQLQPTLDEFLDKFGSDLKVLGYQFKNIFKEAWDEKIDFEITFREICEDCKNNKNDTIILANDNVWQAGLLTWIDRMIKQSIRKNYTELEERGLFDKHGVPPTLKKEIEDLFVKGKIDLKKRKELGQLLLKYDLFEKYETRFFDLIKSNKKK